jgi:DNA-binding beta-propeller fold protein YncE
VRRVRGPVAAVVVILAAAAHADDTRLAPGEIVVADRGGAGVAGALHRLAPGGAPRPIATSEPLAIPTAVAVDRDGTLVVADLRRKEPGRIVRVDPASGAVTTIADGWPLLAPTGIALDAGGDVLVADLDAGSRLDFPSGSLAGTGALFRLAHATGVPVLLSLDCCRWNAGAVAPMPDAMLAVVDMGFAVFTGDGALALVDPTTGVQHAVATSIPLLDPSGVVADASGTLFVTEATNPQRGNGAILAIEPRTGTVTVVVSGHPIVDPRGIALTPEGDVVVADSGSCTIYRVTGWPRSFEVLADGPPFVDPWGIAVAP